MTTTLRTTESSTSTSRRLTAVAITAGTLAATWLVARLILGRTPMGPGFGGQPPTAVGVAPTIISVLVATVVGWALLAGLERFRPQNALRAWTIIAGVFTVLSCISPLMGEGVESADRLTLVALHLTTAAVFVPLMRGTS